MTADKNSCKFDDSGSIDWKEAKTSSESKLWMAASLIFKPRSVDEYMRDFVEAERGDMVGLACARGFSEPDDASDAAYAHLYA